MFDEIIESKKIEIINSLQELIKIPSVNEMPEKGMPFGKHPAEALEKILELGRNLGFKTKNLDGFCGYIEFGEGEKLLGIIGHLDVVPEGENWTYEPFSATIADDKIYGRGAIDDKGPVIASLYAMKTVKDFCENNNIKLNKRIRLILGLNEENNWKCIDYYKQKEEILNTHKINHIRTREYASYIMEAIVTIKELLINGIEQAKRLGIEIETDEVIGLEFDGEYKVKTRNREFTSKALILATGARRNVPTIKGVKEFEGKVSVIVLFVMDSFIEIEMWQY